MPGKVKKFVETTDVRDGLYPSLRYALTRMHKMNDADHGKYQKSAEIAEKIADELFVSKEEVYDAFLDAAWPRCTCPLVDGLGNMGFPPAAMEFSEMQVSDFYRKIVSKGETTDYNTPLPTPIPCVFINGSIGYANSQTKIPPHNPEEVIDAVIALIKDPSLETKDLMQFIKGPDLLVGGEIVFRENLHEVYEKGCGVIEVKVTPQTENHSIYGDVSGFCNWYGLRRRKKLFKKEQKILIRYNAVLFDGKTAKLMSLKEILQKYIAYYRSVENISEEMLCEKLLEMKKNCKARKTKATRFEGRHKC